jgi:hypothetical protein
MLAIGHHIFMNEAEPRNTTWWTGIFYGIVALVLGWTVFASHLSSLLTGSLPRLVSLAEFADRLGHFGAFFALLALGLLLLIVIARYWFGEEMALAAALAALWLVKLAPVKTAWCWLVPLYHFIQQMSRSLFRSAHSLDSLARRGRRYGTLIAKPILVVKTARPFFLFQAAPLRIP